MILVCIDLTIMTLLLSYIHVSIMFDHRLRKGRGVGGFHLRMCLKVGVDSDMLFSAVLGTYRHACEVFLAYP